MKNLYLLLSIAFGASFTLNGCKTTTEPNSVIQPGMRATINGTLWVADSTLAERVTSGNCNFIMVSGWTDTGSNRRDVMLEIPDSLSASGSCSSGGNYIVGPNQMLASEGAISLAGKASSNVQGTFQFHGVVFRDKDTTYFTNGEFNVNMSN